MCYELVSKLVGISGVLLFLFIPPYGFAEPESHLLLEENFEMIPKLTGVKALCNGCGEGEHGLSSFSKNIVRNGNYSIRIESNGQRNELATERLDIEKDLKLEWSIFFPDKFDLGFEGSVSQIIAWQRGCYEGGNFQLRIRKGNWEIVARNWSEIDRNIELGRGISLGRWIDFVLYARFSRINGYIEMVIIDDEFGKSRYQLIQGESTHVSCPLGPYLKIGLYGGFPAKSYIYVDRIKVSEVIAN